MIAYIVRRLVQAVLTLAAISVVLFVMMKLYGGDPGWIMLGHFATPAKVHRLDLALGVLQPWPVQYLDWLRLLFAGALAGTFQAMPPTLLLFALGGGLGLLLATGLALLQARHPRTWVDHLTSTGALVFYAMPSYWLGLVLFLVFAVYLGWLPMVPPGFFPGGQGPVGWSLAMVLPIVTLALTTVSGWSMHLRSAMEEALASDYVRTARAKGLPEGRLLRRHVMRSAVLPLLAMIGMSFPVLLSNLIAVQVAFGMSGIGQMLVTGLFFRLYGMVLDVVFVIGIITVLASLLVDVLAAASDPRVRFG